MFSEKKEFMRSIRMTKTIKEYVEQAEGNGFNDKFEKLVLKCTVKTLRSLSYCRSYLRSRRS